MFYLPPNAEPENPLNLAKHKLKNPAQDWGYVVHQNICPKNKFLAFVNENTRMQGGTPLSKYHLNATSQISICFTCRLTQNSKTL